MQMYQRDSYCRQLETMVEAASVFDGHTELACEELLFHPAGGGQPDDAGQVTLCGKAVPLRGLRKVKGEVRLLLDDNGSLASETGFGEMALCSLDWERRYLLMRLHSASHVLMAAVRRELQGYIPKGMHIAADLSTASVRFRHSEPIDSSRLSNIEKTSNVLIAESLPLRSLEFPDIEAARAAGKDLFRFDPEVQLRGSVRIVEIQGVDFNPCSGTHVRNTHEIGPLKPGVCKLVEPGLSELLYEIGPAPEQA